MATINAVPPIAKRKRLPGRDLGACGSSCRNVRGTHYLRRINHGNRSGYNWTFYGGRKNGRSLHLISLIGEEEHLPSWR
jgi:hypothetical protein